MSESPDESAALQPDRSLGRRAFLASLLAGGILPRLVRGEDSASITLRRLAPQENDQQGSRFSLLQISFDPRRLDLRVLDARDLGAEQLLAEEYLQRLQAEVVINGGFFDEHHRPLGLVITDGVETSPLRAVDWGVFYIDDAGPHIVHTRDFEPAPDVQQAIQCGPRLVVDGVPSRLKRQIARRTVIGVDEAGAHLFVTEQGRAELNALAAVLARPREDGGGGQRHALNLDGGPSTQLATRLEPGPPSIRGGSAVPTALGLFRTRPSDPAAGQ